MPTYNLTLTGPNGNCSFTAANAVLTKDGVPVYSDVSPPIPTVNISPSDSVATIQSKIANAPVGALCIFAAGAYAISTPLAGKSGITLTTKGVVTMTGPGAGTAGVFNFAGLSNWTIRGGTLGAGFVFNGTLVNATGASNFAIGNCVFNNQASNGFDGSCVRMNNTKNGLIINNDFNACAGNVLGMYNFDTITIDGNHFTSCWEAIAGQFSTTNSDGNAIVIQRCVFLRNQRACIELGPTNGTPEYMSGLTVVNNFFDDFDPVAASTPGGLLPISCVALAAVNTTVTDNFIRAGARVKAAAVANPNYNWITAIEFAGSGQCARNVVDGFRYNLLYSNGWNVHDNSLFGTPQDFTVNQSGITGTLVPSKMLTAAPVAPPYPTRINW